MVFTLRPSAHPRFLLNVRSLGTIVGDSTSFGSARDGCRKNLPLCDLAIRDVNVQPDNPYESPSEASTPPREADATPARFNPLHYVVAVALPLALMPLNQLHSLAPHGFPEFVFGGLANGIAFGCLRTSSKRPLFFPLFLCYFASSIIAMLAWGAISFLWMLGGLGLVMSAFFAGQFLVGELVAWGLLRLRRRP